MDKKLRKMLEQAGTIRHLSNVLNSIPKEHTELGIVYRCGKYVHILPPVYDYNSGKWLAWEKIGKNEYEAPIYGNFTTIMLSYKTFRKVQYRGFEYLEDINQHIRKYCWQELKTEKQKQPELSISNWKEYFIEENSTNADIMELYENWIDNKKLILIDEAGTDYRQNFYNRFGHCFDEKILEE